MIVLAVTTDGRRDLTGHPIIEATVACALEQLKGPIDRKIISDDSGDPEYLDWLRSHFGPLGFQIAGTRHRRGYCDAIADLWQIIGAADQRYVFWLEDDFHLNRPVDLVEMADTLDAHTEIAQLVLRRQPWFPHEVAAGGIIEAKPDSFTDRTGPDRVEHREHWSLNPTLFRTKLCRDQPWPKGPWCESKLGQQVLADPDARLAYWGPSTDDPWVTHTGIRAGTGY